jgi:maltose O-acetyltransferase
MATPRTSLLDRIRQRLRFLPISIYQILRIWKYKLISDISSIENKARINQPVFIVGKGNVQLGKCILGVYPSPYFLNGYTHIEARELSASIVIEDGVWINNNAVLIAERSNIRIGSGTLIGTEFTVYDSDFHDLHPEKRMSGKHKCKPVSIGKNVFIGSRVTILKGVKIGDNAVIATGSVVNIDVPDNTIAGGVPARIISSIDRKS